MIVDSILYKQLKFHKLVEPLITATHVCYKYSYNYTDKNIKMVYYIPRVSYKILK